MALFAILMFVFGDKQEPKVKVPMLKQTKQVANNYKLLFQFWYFITFGAFVAFGLFTKLFSRTL